jgi:hypothetical protein
MDASTAGCIKKANYKVCDIDIMKMVPGLGIEPRTRGFSIIQSAFLNPPNTNTFSL